MDRRQIGIAIILAASMLSLAGVSVRAQSPAELSIIPAASDLVLNNTAAITLTISNGVEINGFDITITYDPAVLTLESWSHGGYLSALHVFKEVDDPGKFRLAAAQLKQPGISGDGSLLNLVFIGSTNGISPVTIAEAKLVNIDNNWVSTVSTNGSIHVHSDPSPIPTHTLTGSFSLQGRSESGGVPVSLGYGLQHWLGPFSAVTQDAPAPNLSIPGVYDDSYTIATGQPRYLNVTPQLDKTKTVGAGSTAITLLRLLGGNAVWQREAAGEIVPDTVIDQADLDLVLDQYHLSDPALDGDVNFSGTVDILDLALAAGNFELTPEIAYGDWIP